MLHLHEARPWFQLLIYTDRYKRWRDILDFLSKMIRIFNSRWLGPNLKRLSRAYSWLQTSDFWWVIKTTYLEVWKRTDAMDATGTVQSWHRNDGSKVARGEIAQWKPFGIITQLNGSRCKKVYCNSESTYF